MLIPVKPSLAELFSSYLIIYLPKSVSSHLLCCYLYRKDLQNDPGASDNTDNRDNTDSIRQAYTQYHRLVFEDLRSVGIIALQIILKRPLSPSELLHVRSDESSIHRYPDILNSLKIPEAVRKLVSACLENFSQHKEQVGTDATGEEVLELYSPLRQVSRDLQQQLNDLLESLGGELVIVTPGCAHPDSTRDEGKLSPERRAELLEAAVKGPDVARQRLQQWRQQVKFEMLPIDQQLIILKKRAMRAKAVQNARVRNRAIHTALFHHW